MNFLLFSQKRIHISPIYAPKIILTINLSLKFQNRLNEPLNDFKSYRSIKVSFRLLSFYKKESTKERINNNSNTYRNRYSNRYREIDRVFFFSDTLCIGYV